MSDVILELLKEVNIVQILILLGAGWFFYNRLDGKITDSKKELKEELGNRIDKVETSLGARIDKLSEKVEDIDRRLCRIEGSLSMHGHCLFNQEKPERKVE